MFLIITISGNLGSGKSSVAKMLAEKLGLKHYSTGDFMRSMAEERRVTLLELSKIAEKDASVDAALDSFNKRKGLEEDNFVIDSRLAFYFIPGSVKVFLKVSPKESANRIFNSPKHKLLEEENTDYNATLENIRRRVESERQRYLSLYGINYEDEKNYDLVIKTDDKSMEKVCSEIISFVRNI